MRIFAALFILFCALPAAAHPHTKIDYQTRVIFDAEGKITALRQRWIFTPDYTEFMRPDYDKNKNNRLELSELTVLTKSLLENVSKLHYFTDVNVDGKNIAFKPITDTDSHMEENRIVLDFTLPFETPADPLKESVFYRIYDPNYFADMQPTASDGTLLIDAPAACRFNLTPPTVTPELSAQIADIDKNGGKAPEGLGAAMSQKLDIICK